jgi:DNA-binding CsgD family transcriptional regulator
VAATLDLLVFLARRMERTNALVLATFRDGEVGRTHPLQEVLGHLATAPSVRRIHLAPLSLAAVQRLAQGRDVDAVAVHRLTGGNPFFLAEVLAAPGREVPGSVTAAVLGRAQRLSASARAVLDVAAVIPDRADIDLLLAVSQQESASVEECLATGLVVLAGGTLHFRHELVRLALEGAIPPIRRRSLHREILVRLSPSPGVPRARLAYHAGHTEDPHAILRFAPAAAEEAVQLGAHREARDHLVNALPHAGLLEERERVALLEAFVDASRAVGDLEAARTASREAFELRVKLGDVEAAALIRVRGATIAWSLARNAEAHEMTAEALELLEPLPTTPARAPVLAAAAMLRMLARDLPGAIRLGTQARDLAERSGDTTSLASALGTIGAVQWFTEPDAAESTMLLALEAAQAAGQDVQVAEILINLGSGAGEIRQYATADRWLGEAITWAEDRDLDHAAMYAAAWAARSDLEQGRWSEADRRIGRLLRSPVHWRPTRIVLLTVQGRLAARRGERAAALEFLEEAWGLAEMTGDLQRLWPVAAGRAEAAWLMGDLAPIESRVQDSYRLALQLEHTWAIGELGFWLWRVGRLRAPAAGAAEAYARQIAGDWRGAARAWREIGCPYEEAVALADGDGEKSLLRSLEILGDLGATPLADRVAARLRTLGVRALPRRPSRQTLANPGGLTARQLEVLTLVVAGRTNPQIATELHVSPKTVGHHVSAILDRLDVPDRHEAARVALERGIVAE